MFQDTSGRPARQGEDARSVWCDRQRITGRQAEDRRGEFAPR